MKKTKLTAFTFDFAQYEVTDQNGNKALLKVDYAHDTFLLATEQSSLDRAFRAELGRVAQDLLKRKRGVNFVDRIA